MKKLTAIAVIAIALWGCKKENLVDTSENEIADVQSQEQFEETIESGVTVVFFHASWCSKCKAQRPAFESAASNNSVGEATFMELEHEDHPDITEKYGVPGFPTIVIYQDGVEDIRLTGKGHSEQKIVDLIGQRLQ